MNNVAISPLTDDAMYFELGILIASGVLLSLILRRHLQKRSTLTLLLFIIFLNMAIAIFFIMLAKIYVYQYNNGETLLQSDPWFWFIARVMDFRFGFMFIAVSILCAQIFRAKVFDKTPGQWVNYLEYLLGIFTVGWAMIAFQFKNTFLNVLLFALLMGYLLLVFIPFSLKSFRSGRSTLVDERYRHAFIYLGLMGVCFIGVLGFNLVDQILHFFNNEVTYSIFYFLGWTSHLIGMLFAYFGFLRPKGQVT